MDTQAFFVRQWFFQNPAVQLRPLALSDVEGLLPIALEPELWKTGLTSIQDADALRRYVEEALAQRAQQQAYPFVVLDAQTGAYLGSTRFYEMDFFHKRLVLGWTWISAAARGTGVNMAQKYELLRFAFEELGFQRVGFYIDALNTRSRRAVQKLGATEEGILRSHMITWTGRVRDTVVASILASEWPRLKASVFSAWAVVP